MGNPATHGGAPDVLPGEGWRRFALENLDAWWREESPGEVFQKRGGDFFKKALIWLRDPDLLVLRTIPHIRTGWSEWAAIEFTHPEKMIRSMTCLAALYCALAASPVHATTLNWGSEVGSMLVDSDGDGIDDRFVFELGAFDLDFEPTESNRDEWILNWRVFDAASYNPDIGYFTSTVHVLSDISSGNPAASPESFSGLIAYLWIRDSDEAVEGSEWHLVRAGNWIFPEFGGDCCDTGVIEWSISDLDSSDVPLWGGQNGVIGSGAHGVTGSTGLQTYTFVPESSTALLAAFAGIGAILRRRR